MKTTAIRFAVARARSCLVWVGCLLLLCSPLVAGAQQSDGPGEGHGPHAGYIRAHEEYAIELAPEGTNRYRVWVLNSSWVSFEPKGFTVELQLTTRAATPAAKTVTTKVPCVADADGFRCDREGSKDAKDLSEIAVRVQPKETPSKSFEVTYRVPLTYLPE